MRSWCAAGLLLLLADASFCVAFPRNSIHHLDLILPEDEDLEISKRTVREANPESFADYFKKLQLAQSELSKNASVGVAEIEKVFKNHGLETGNETLEENGTTITTIPPSTSFNPSSSTDSLDPTTKQATEQSTTTKTTTNRPCPSGICPNTVKPLKKHLIKPEATTVASVTPSTTTVPPDELDTTSIEPDTTFSPSTTTAYWWGVSRKSKHLKSTIARQVVNKIKTSRRRSHFD